MFKELFEDAEDAEILYEMSNLWPDKTGLKEVIYISAKNANHGPRIKVFENKSPKSKSFTVTLDLDVVGKSFVNSKELKRIFEFITLNKTVLQKHWDFELDSGDAISQIKKVQ